MAHRRQILLATLAAGATGAAGCLSDDPSDDDQSTNSTDETPADLSPAGEGVYRVDIDAVSDRSASIGDSQQLTYAGDPEVVWVYEPLLESDESSESVPELTVDPVVDPTDDAEHVFLAPVYDGNAENWEIYAYADETYYEARDAHRFWIGRFFAESAEERSVRGEEAAFTEHHDGVYRATLEYGETPPETDPAIRIRSVILANREWDEAALEESGSIVSAVVSPTRVGPPTPDYDEADEDDPAPMVEFSFAYDPDAKTVTVVHEGGPSFQADNVRVEFEAGVTENQFSGEVSVGDSLEVEVPSADSGEYLGIAWLGPEEEHYIMLDRFQIPE